jgi:hypothetical protein
MDLTLPRAPQTPLHPGTAGSTTGGSHSHTLDIVDIFANTSSLLALLLNILIVATAAAAVIVVVCAVVVVVARMRAHSPVVDPSVDVTVDNPQRPAVQTDRTSDVTGTTSAMADHTRQALRQPAPPAAPAVETRRPQLPVGAEAALNAIVELRPDPRNVVVTHRDPTGEVRLYPLNASHDDNTRLERSA